MLRGFSPCAIATKPSSSISRCVVCPLMMPFSFDASGSRNRLASPIPVHGFQIWVNLPAKEKLIAPRYQDIPSKLIPIAESDDGKVWVKVIAGRSMGKEAVIDTRTAITFLHAKLKPGAKLVQPISPQYNTFAYVVEGKGYFGNEQLPAETDQLVLFSNDGQTVSIESSDKEELSVLILGGLPLNEPVARYGPFVMNTQSEIVQAIEDYKAGRMGLIK